LARVAEFVEEVPVDGGRRRSPQADLGERLKRDKVAGAELVESQGIGDEGAGCSRCRLVVADRLDDGAC